MGRLAIDKAVVFFNTYNFKAGLKLWNASAAQTAYYLDSISSLSTITTPEVPPDSV
jgi:hypothetical protein